MMREFIFEGAKRTKLQGFAREPEKKDSVKALVVIVHGLGEHTMRYGELAENLVRQGICVYSMDLRGHGKSPGKRGHTAPRAVILEDVDILCRVAQNDYADSPLFIYGHSMGGNIGLYHRLYGKFRPRGYIITSPWITLYNQLSGSTVAVMKILSKIAPGLCIKNNLDTKDLSSDQSQIDCDTDPMYHGYVSIQTGLDCFEGAREILRQSNMDKEDLLLLHGSEDHICSVEGSRDFMKNAAESCTYIEWEGNYHELHHDKDRERVTGAIADWILERVQ